MPEKEITRKLTRLIKDTDKLVQDIEKGTKRVLDALAELKKLGEKPSDDSDK